MSDFDPIAFAIDDYKLWIDYRAAHSDRMWTRFNYFLTIEAALVAFFTISNTTAFVQRARWAALAEVVISLMWVLVGARDAYLWKVINNGVKRSARRLRELPGVSLPNYLPVGVYKLEDPDHNALLGRLLGTHRSNLTVTSMAVRLPLLATLCWSFVAGILFAESGSLRWWVGAILGSVFFVVILLVLGALTGIGRNPRRDSFLGDAREQLKEYEAVDEEEVEPEANTISS